MRMLNAEGIKKAVELGLPTVQPVGFPGDLVEELRERLLNAYGLVAFLDGDAEPLSILRVDHWVAGADGWPECDATSYHVPGVDDLGGNLVLWLTADEMHGALISRGAPADEARTWLPWDRQAIANILAGSTDPYCGELNSLLRNLSGMADN